MVNSPECDRRKQISETASHILCDSEPLTTLWFMHLDHHFMKPGDSEDISVSKIMHFIQNVGLLNEWAKGLHKRFITIKVNGYLVPAFLSILFYSILLYSNPFYSIPFYSILFNTTNTVPVHQGLPTICLQAPSCAWYVSWMPVRILK